MGKYQTSDNIRAWKRIFWIAAILGLFVCHRGTAEIQTVIKSITVYGGREIDEDEVFIEPDATNWIWKLEAHADPDWRHESVENPGGGWFIHYSKSCGGIATCTCYGVNRGHSERRFQRKFQGEVYPCGEGIEPPPTHWELEYGRSAYFLDPEKTQVCIDDSVTVRAYDGDYNSVESTWSVSPAGGVTPSPLPDGNSVSMESTNAGLYTVTGNRKDNSENPPDTESSAVVEWIMARIASGATNCWREASATLNITADSHSPERERGQPEM
jgi:hypothetical protein